MKSLSLLATFPLALLSASSREAAAQVTYTLKHSVPPPPSAGLQRDAALGWGVAVEAGFTVVGVVNDDFGAPDSGVVKIFDTTTGALLYVLRNPTPADKDYFGSRVAISGSRVVVGAYQDDTGATDAGSAYVYDLSSATPTVPALTLNNPTPAARDGFGVSVGISGTRVVVGAWDDTGATDAGSAYVYDLNSATPTVPSFTLNNPGPAVEDNFGLALAISGTRIVVGAYQDDTGATNAGSAYVYDLTGETPGVPVVTLNNPTPAGVDNFGRAVAISGTRLVVGASQDDTGAFEAGSAYVYDLTSAAPGVPILTLNNPTPAAFDYFGGSVAISGTRVVVSTLYDDTGATDAGSAYVYDLTSPTPSVPVATLNNPTPAAGDNFGTRVAIDGVRVVVGAPGDDTGALDAGSAYIYNVSGSTPAIPTAVLNDPGPQSARHFAFADISGKWMVVGVPNDDTGARSAGIAYVFDLSSATPTVPFLTLNNPSPATNDLFGGSARISGNRIALGRGGDDTGATNAGSVYIYDLTSGAPAVPVFTLHNPTPAVDDYFGGGVDIDGTRVVVAAYNDDTGANDAGSVYVYDLSGVTPTVPVLTLNNPSPVAREYFGTPTISGTMVAVGVPNDRTYAGTVYVYDVSTPTPAIPVFTINNPTPQGEDDFGSSVALSGTRLVVGDDRDDTAGPDYGSAYVYDLSGPTPTVPTVTINNPSASNFFGAAAISGTRVVVSAWQDEGTGSAYVYDLNGATPGVPVARLSNPSPSLGDYGDYFGGSVAIDGANIAIGAPDANSPQADDGAVYIFTSDADGDGLLDGWEMAKFGTTTGHTASDDADGDGRNELLEEAFGTNPLVPDAALAPAVVNEGGFLTLTIAKHPGVSYEGQSAGTLLPALPDSFSSATTKVLLAGPGTLRVRDNVLIGAAPARFLRVRVTAAP